VRAAHARYHALYQPVQQRPVAPEELAGARLVMNMALDHGQVPTAGCSGGLGTGCRRSGDEVEHALPPTQRVRVRRPPVVLSPSGWPPPAGGDRADEAHLVVLDGLCSDAERCELLTWLTAKGHPTTAPPPADKWEQACVDREGDPATWGLRQEVRVHGWWEVRVHVESASR
jgi:hypothetical protein